MAIPQQQYMKLKGGENSSTTDIYTSNRIKVGDTLKISGTASNNGIFTVSSIVLDSTGGSDDDVYYVLKGRQIVSESSNTNRDLRIGGTTINPFMYRAMQDGGKPDGVLDRKMFAANPMLDGGDVQGPGGPKDDLIPVMASNGEFMLSKAAVDQVGGGDHSKGIA